MTRRNSGFTLLDLLVVIIIIGVLSAIIFPMLGIRPTAPDTIPTRQQPVNEQPVTPATPSDDGNNWMNRNYEGDVTGDGEGSWTIEEKPADEATDDNNWMSQ